MNTQIREIIDKILQTYNGLPFLRSEELPALDLYMDQVTTLMEKRLAPTRREDGDKLLTKTMINNYAKNKLLPAPVRKKYTNEHVLLLVFIYYFKNVLSMQDIKAVLSLVLPDADAKKDNPAETETVDLVSLYDEVFSDNEDLMAIISESVDRHLEKIGTQFPDTENQEKEQLQLFSLICNLIMDIYVKKRIVEQLIDEAS